MEMSNRLEIELTIRMKHLYKSCLRKQQLKCLIYICDVEELVTVVRELCNHKMND